MKKLVFFDLDGTILEGFSSENLFALYLLKHGHIRLKQLIVSILCVIKAFPKFKHHAFIKNKAYLYGLSTKKINILAKRFVKRHLLRRIRPKLKHRIEKHRQNGDRLILLTGSPDFLANELAKDLHMDEVLATKCHKKLGKFTYLSPIQQPYAKEKFKLAIKICKREGVDLKDCVAYGNSINDRFILEAVGQPVAVTPHKRLLKIAKKKNWEIIL